MLSVHKSGWRPLTQGMSKHSHSQITYCSCLFYVQRAETRHCPTNARCFRSLLTFDIIGREVNSKWDDCHHSPLLFENSLPLILLASSCPLHPIWPQLTWSSQQFSMESLILESPQCLGGGQRKDRPAQASVRTQLHVISSHMKLREQLYKRKCIYDTWKHHRYI